MTASELASSALVIAGMGIMAWGAMVPPNLFTADLRNIMRLESSPRKVAMIMGGLCLVTLSSLLPSF